MHKNVDLDQVSRMGQLGKQRENWLRGCQQTALKDTTLEAENDEWDQRRQSHEQHKQTNKQK